MNAATRLFIETHADDDVHQLAFLAARYPDVDMPFALNQIAGRRMARTKLPSWAATEGLIYPPHLSIEQCSSEQTAIYKAALVRRISMFISSQSPVPPQPLPLQWVDLTGGMGVDFSFIAPLFQRSVYVERQSQLCEMARNNFPLLGLERSEVVCGDATDYLRGMEPTDWIYLDPARRNENGGKTVLMSDCMPDVTQLLDTLLNKARCVLLKLSPMLDWQYAVSVLNREECIVREVHIVAVKNECKELLLVLSRSCFWQTDTPCEHRLSVICSNDSETFSYDFTEENKTFLPVFQDTLLPGMFLYEPYSSLMKAGAFALFSACFEVASIAAHSHLFVSQQLRHGVFGRKFQIKAISSLNKKEVKAALQGINQANIAVRNFPMSVAELRKRLRLREGGAVYIFATTDTQNQKRLLICEKI
jgi:hypothetical protein